MYGAVRHAIKSWFSCGFSILVELEFGVLVFVEGGKPKNPEKNPQSKNENQQQTNNPHITSGQN